MAGETPEAQIGQEVSLYLWKSEDLGTEAHAAVLRGVDSSGVTVEGSQGHNLSFYPWSTVREIMFGHDQDSGQPESAPVEEFLEADPICEMLYGRQGEHLALRFERSEVVSSVNADIGTVLSQFSDDGRQALRMIRGVGAEK